MTIQKQTKKTIQLNPVVVKPRVLAKRNSLAMAPALYYDAHFNHWLPRQLKTKRTRMSLFLDQKLDALAGIYEEFDTALADPDRACEKGCTFCCTHAGAVDITTREAWQIKKSLNGFTRNRLKALDKALARDIRKREKKKLNPCPFLSKAGACMIYGVRPFSCRRIYSTHVCSKENPPQIHKQAMVLANTYIKKLQDLDDTGYSGHISFVLHMINTPAFMKTYAGGGHNPAEIMRFGKSHNIIINKMMLG